MTRFGSWAFILIWAAAIGLITLLWLNRTREREQEQVSENQSREERMTSSAPQAGVSDTTVSVLSLDPDDPQENSVSGKIKQPDADENETRLPNKENNTGKNNSEQKTTIDSSRNIGTGSTADARTDVPRSVAEREIAYARDTSIPLKQREQRLNELAESGTAEAVEALMAVADSEIYMRRYAIPALGRVQNNDLKDDIAEYLNAQLDHTDAVQICESIRALAGANRETAVEPVVRTLKKNKTREDGHQDMVQTAAVESLGNIGSPKAAEALTAELKRSGEKGWSLEYGSVVLIALVRCDPTTAAQAAAAYADRLSENIPDDPMARAYIEKKINEAREIARTKKIAIRP